MLILQRQFEILTLDQHPRQFDVTIDSDSSAKQPVRDLIRKSLAPLLRKRLEKFAVDLIRGKGSKNG